MPRWNGSKLLRLRGAARTGNPRRALGVPSSGRERRRRGLRCEFDFFCSVSSVANSASVVTRTSVHALDEAGRREEIARMLSGAEVTAEARAQAERLLETI